MRAKARFGMSEKSRDPDSHLQGAHRVMDRLLAKGKLDGGAEMYLDALSDLVGAYKDEYYPIEPVSDADMLRHFMEAKGVPNWLKKRRSPSQRSLRFLRARSRSVVK